MLSAMGAGCRLGGARSAAACLAPPSLAPRRPCAPAAARSLRAAPARLLSRSHRPIGQLAGASASKPLLRERSRAATRARATLGQIAVAGLTTGGLNLASDVLTQAITRSKSADGAEATPYDPVRTLRMVAHGLFFYGPFQLFWYRGLEHFWPGRSVGNFAVKLTLNQIILGPIIISTLFAWNLWCQGRSEEIAGKLKADFVKTLLGGWIFWVPAAAVNFYLVPVHLRVLYMSACGMLWAGFLSYVSEKGGPKDPVDKEA